jgi:CCR4-NOT transcription complex subunit 1
LSKLLESKNSKGWWICQCLLIASLRFTAIIIGVPEMMEASKAFYKGVLRMFIILLHDYPSFLSEYYSSFCDAISPHFIQLRNIILCAAPKNIHVPSPFSSGIKMESFPEFSIHPIISSHYMNHLMMNNFKNELDGYLETRTIPFLETLSSRLLIRADPNSSLLRYNMPMINSLILYTGIKAMNQIQTQEITDMMNSTLHMALIDICNRLLNSWDKEGSYLLINSIVNHLRFPNAHTRYFMSFILYLFRQSRLDFVREQITRVLLERVNAMRPHPWGLYITFIELLRNPDYNFWEYKFVHTSSELYQLLRSILQTYCMNVESESIILSQ